MVPILDSDTVTKSTAKRWFAKLRKTSFVLLSTKDQVASRDECARLLRNLNVKVTNIHGTLKCHLDQGDCKS